MGHSIECQWQKPRIRNLYLVKFCQKQNRKAVLIFIEYLLWDTTLYFKEVFDKLCELNYPQFVNAESKSHEA